MIGVSDSLSFEASPIEVLDSIRDLLEEAESGFRQAHLERQH